MRASASFRLAACLIVIAASGCDNVQWGGAELAIVPPPPKTQERSGDADGPDEDRLPEGPVLYLVRAGAGGTATLLPIAEISGDTLRRLDATDWERYGTRFIAEHLRPGTELALYRAGGRVGTFITQAAEVPPAAVCPRVPRATGTLELGPAAADATEFLALAKADAPPPTAPAASAPEPTRAMQVLAPNLAERLLRARSAPLPNNWRRAMAQLVPFPLAGAADPAFAATFLIGDTLGPGLDDDGSSLFFIAMPQAQAGYVPAHAEYNEYASTGKVAPRVVDYLDWDRDGQPELLLEVYGTSDAWFAAVGQVNGEWRTTFQHRCARPATPSADSAAARAATRRASSEPPPAAAQPRQTRPAARPRTTQTPPRQETTPGRQEATRQEATRQETPSRQDTARRPEPQRADTARQNAPPRDTLRRDTLRQGAVQRDTARRDTLRQGAAQRDTARRDTLRRDTLSLRASATPTLRGRDESAAAAPVAVTSPPAPRGRGAA
ncbi:MAG TPA: hypothetical protein VF192_13315 [Longimicrobiales bacterium]